MIHSKEYILRTIKDIPYILPIGQALCDHKNGITTNKSGAAIWHILENDTTEDEIIEILLKEYELDDSYKNVIAKDVSDFLHLLESKHMLAQDDSIQHFNALQCEDIKCDIYNTLHIAGISINLCGPSDAWSQDFDMFYGNISTSPDLSIYIVPTKDAKSEMTGKLVVKNTEISICENDDMYLLYFENSACIKELHLYKSGNEAYIHCFGSFNEQAVYDIFHAIRPCFLYHAAPKGIIAIHSASILYKEKVWLFSAPSQTGKSTHTSLWHKLFDASFINGDLNLVGMSDNIPVVHGGPWCGTSEICTTGQYILGGIILLKQAPSDYITELAPDRKCFMVLQRVVSIPVNTEIYDANLNIVDQITDTCIITQLNCTKDDNAAFVMKEYIDKSLYYHH